jgi:ubiquinone/menaquinone biosynthesis C-methylase UbiE
MEEQIIVDYEGRDYRDFWEGSHKKSRSYEDTSERFLIERFLPPKGGWFIDIGAGYGRLSDLYVHRFSNVVIADYAVSLLKEAKDNLKNNRHESVYYIASNVYHLPFMDSVFHAGLMVRLLHHMKEQTRGLSEIERTFAPESRFIVNYSNKRNILQIAKLAMGRNNLKPYQINPTEVQEDGDFLSHIHPKYAKEVFEKSGFKIIDSLGTGTFRNKKIMRLVGSPVILDNLLQDLMGTLSLAPNIFLLTTPIEKEGQKKTLNTLLDVLQCPACGSKLKEEDQKLICTNCSVEYPIVDGIYDLRYPRQEL